MTPNEHIEDNAAGFASLTPDDPERVAAYDHARACANCARSLREAEQMLAAIDAMPPAAAPTAPALRAITQPILARLAALALPTRLLSGVFVALWIVLVAMAKHRAGGAMAWIESAVLAATALAVVAMLRRLGSRAAVFAFGASAFLTALAWGDGPLAPRVGVACLLTELGAALIPCIIVLRTLVKRRSVHPTPALVVATAAGALVGQAALLLTCPDRTAGLHVLAFHCGGVVLAAVLAAIAGRVVARPAPELGSR